MPQNHRCYRHTSAMAAPTPALASISSLRSDFDAPPLPPLDLADRPTDDVVRDRLGGLPLLPTMDCLGSSLRVSMSAGSTHDIGQATTRCLTRACTSLLHTAKLPRSINVSAKRRRPLEWVWRFNFRTNCLSAHTAAIKAARQGRSCASGTGIAGQKEGDLRGAEQQSHGYAEQDPRGLLRQRVVALASQIKSIKGHHGCKLSKDLSPLYHILFSSALVFSTPASFVHSQSPSPPAQCPAASITAVNHTCMQHCCFEHSLPSLSAPPLLSPRWSGVSRLLHPHCRTPVRQRCPQKRRSDRL